MKRNLSKSVFDQRIQTLLDKRFKKLQKRFDKAKAELEDATQHLEGYHRGSSYGKSERPE